MIIIYGSLEGSKTYHAEHGNTAWAAAADEALTVVLGRGSEFVDGTYGASFPGYKVGRRAQLREWPRLAAYDINGDQIASDVIPDEVIFATYEAALRELVTPGTLNPDIDYSKRISSASVGSISVTYASMPQRADAYRKIMTIVDQIIAPILSRDYGNVSSLAGRTVRSF